MLEKIEKKLLTTNEYGFEHQDFDAKLGPEDIKYLQEVYNLKTERRANFGMEKLHSTCVNCQARQITKYKKNFSVPCNFIAAGVPVASKHIIEDLVSKGMDRETALLYVKSTQDPASWVEMMFGYQLRVYQKEQLRCTSRRLVLRQGRRSGKTFAMSMKLIYYCFNMKVSHGKDSNGEEVIKGPRILIVTPYQAQLDLFFEEMEKILNKNQDLVADVTTAKSASLFTKSPFYKMEFSNGAVIKGFVSGVTLKTDGSGGGTLRGQTADVVCLDEMDMIQEDTINKAILPILVSTPNVYMMASSTPIGIRSKFYDWCKKDSSFKEEYYPSTVLPHWNDVKSEVEKPDTVKDAFDSEYMAHFIEGSTGVFKPAYVTVSKKPYSYTDTDFKNSKFWNLVGVKNRHELITCIGIDWNKTAGTELYVVGYDRQQARWICLDAVNVEAGVFTAELYKQAVIDLNFKWKPDFIYADEGYGQHIIDDLKFIAFNLKSKPDKTPIEVETAKMEERLKAFNFSGKVTLKSPIDGTDIEKGGKEFLVENAIRVFEEKRIYFPHDDYKLEKQLLNYVVLKVSENSKKPIFGPLNKLVGDHRLDALMLALGGLFLEVSMYSGAVSTVDTPVALSKEFLDKRSKREEPNTYSNSHVLMIERAGPDLDGSTQQSKTTLSDRFRDLASGFVNRMGRRHREIKRR